MIHTVISTLVQIMIPLSVPVIAGALLGRYTRLETKPLLTLYLYVLSPAIILDTLNTAEISFDDVYMTVSFCILNLLTLWAVANSLGKMLQLTSSQIAGLTLISTLTNSVNYGLPLVLLALGKLGLDKAAIYVIIQMIVVNTIGVYFAARSHFSVRNAVKSVFSLPAIYAAFLAVVLRTFDLHLPDGVAKGISMVAQAYSPVVLVILGAQMTGVNNSELNRTDQTAFWTGWGVRMLLSPLIACLLLILLNIDGLLGSVIFILASMPVAVNAVILAERFHASPAVVSKCILWTTLASFVVLPVLIVLVTSN